MESILTKSKKVALAERDKIITKAKPTKKEDDPVDGIIRVTASLVGFASEVRQYRREKSEQQQNHQQSAPKLSSESEEITVDSPEILRVEQAQERIWERDDVKAVEDSSTSSLKPRPSKRKPPKEPRKIVEAFIQKYPFPPTRTREISHPVILPQRRPNKRSRGFVRAYAPVLSSAGISQPMFLEFLDDLNKILEPNSWLNAINVVGLAANAIPEPLIAALIGFALDATTDAAMEANSRSKSNEFLDWMNKEVFMPRGLVAFIAIWDADEKKKEKEGGDVSTILSLNGREEERKERKGYGETFKEVIKKEKSASQVFQEFQRQIDNSIQPSSGTFQWLEAAPLIFPSPTETAAVLKMGKNGKPKSALDRGEIWLDGFMDKRSQAKWNEENPDAPGVVAMPKQGFCSRYADPNHAASTGDPVAFVTGGEWSLIDKRKEKEKRKKEEKKAKEENKLQEMVAKKEMEEMKAEEKRVKEEKKAKERQIKLENEEKKEEERRVKKEKRLQDEERKMIERENAKAKEKDMRHVAKRQEAGSFEKKDQEDVQATTIARGENQEYKAVKDETGTGRCTQDSTDLEQKQSTEDDLNKTKGLAKPQSYVANFSLHQNNSKGDNSATHEGHSKVPKNDSTSQKGKKEEKSTIAGLLKKNILYLVIVNIPPNLKREAGEVRSAEAGKV